MARSPIVLERGQRAWTVWGRRRPGRIWTSPPASASTRWALPTRTGAAAVDRPRAGPAAAYLQPVLHRPLCQAGPQAVQAHRAGQGVFSPIPAPRPTRAPSSAPANTAPTPTAQAAARFSAWVNSFHGRTLATPDRHRPGCVSHHDFGPFPGGFRLPARRRYRRAAGRPGPGRCLRRDDGAGAGARGGVIALDPDYVHRVGRPSAPRKTCC